MSATPLAPVRFGKFTPPGGAELLGFVASCPTCGHETTFPSSTIPHPDSYWLDNCALEYGDVNTDGTMN